VLPIQPLALIAGDEKLTPITIRAAVGHGQQAGARVPQVEAFVGELVPINGFETRAVALHEISALSGGKEGGREEGGVR